MVKDLQRTASQRAKGANQGRHIVYRDGLTKQQRHKLKAKKSQSTPEFEKVADGAATLAATCQILATTFGKKPPASLDDLKLTSLEATTLHDIAKRVLEAIQNSGVQYSLAGSNFLGWARSRAPLCWDDDFDLQDVDWKSYSLKLVRGDMSGLWKICRKICNSKPQPGCVTLVNHFNGRVVGGEKRWNWPFVDVFVMVRRGRRWALRGKCGQVWPKWTCAAPAGEWSTQRGKLKLACRMINV
jgi:hypothetical protein